MSLSEWVVLPCAPFFTPLFSEEPFPIIYVLLTEVYMYLLYPECLFPYHEGQTHIS